MDRVLIELYGQLEELKFRYKSEFTEEGKIEIICDILDIKHIINNYITTNRRWLSEDNQEDNI